MARIHHILPYRFRPGVDRINEHLEVIERFRGTTPGLVELRCGRRVDPFGEASPPAFTHGFIMTFESEEALRNYAVSEAHDHLADTFKNDIEKKVVFDLRE